MVLSSPGTNGEGKHGTATLGFVASFCDIPCSLPVCKMQPNLLITWYYSRLSLNGHFCETDTSVKWTLRVGPCLSLLLLFDSL